MDVESSVTFATVLIYIGKVIVLVSGVAVVAILTTLIERGLVERR